MPETDEYNEDQQEETETTECKSINFFSVSSVLSCSFNLYSTSRNRQIGTDGGICPW